MGSLSIALPPTPIMLANPVAHPEMPYERERVLKTRPLWHPEKVHLSDMRMAHATSQRWTAIRHIFMNIAVKF